MPNVEDVLGSVSQPGGRDVAKVFLGGRTIISKIFP